MSIYVLSCQALPDRYKIGMHSGTIDDLVQRYITAIPDVIIHYLRPCNDVRKVEKKLHSQLKRYRMKNINERDSEWFTCSLDTIMELLHILLEYRRRML